LLQAECRPFEQADTGECRLAEACRPLDDGFEYGLELRRRRRNRREDIDRRCLLLQSLVPFGRALRELALEISNDLDQI
jgi:hypothetical protein